jgi:hypothetical protein
MFVLFFGDSVALQVYSVQASFLCFKNKLSALRKTHTVGRNVKSVETHAFRAPNRLHKNRRNGRPPPENKMLISRRGLNESALLKMAFMSSMLSS